MSHLGAASLKYHLVREFSLWIVQIFLFCGHEEEGQGIESYLFSYCSLQIYCTQYSKPIIIKGLGLPMGTVSWPDTYPQNNLEFLSFLFKREMYNGPAPWARWSFHGKYLSYKIKTVLYICNQVILLFVCGHFFSKGNIKLAISRRCFSPTQFQPFWGSDTSARAAALFAPLGLEVE